MWNIMKKIALLLLSKLSKKVLDRHKPFVVAVTGTVGKSTVSHFLHDTLSVLYWKNSVAVSLHNYNGEYGVPFTIFQTPSPHANPFLWSAVVAKALWMGFVSKNYPKYLVLEYGIDHPGEMDFLLGICKPDVAVILAISKNHVANFPSYDAYVDEKLKLISQAGACIYNGDDSKIRRYLQENPRDNVVSFGRKSVEFLDYRAVDVQSTLEWLSFEVQKDDLTIPVHVPVVGSHQAYNVLTVFALAELLGKSIQEVNAVFETLVPQKGRGSLIQGVHDTTIVDGSYNGSHEAIKAGIEYLSELPTHLHKCLFLGDMRELGKDSKELHEDIADRIIELSPSFVVLVGEEMRKYVLPKLQECFPEWRLFHSLNSKVAGQKVRELIYEREGPKVIFVKGSQTTIYLEEGIKEFLFDMRDVENLCRQSPRWIKKKHEFFTLIAPV
jgi:UDP-N-acetylmuramoyl-tripeptide--D-alanyl-D-alanine ligase